MRHGQLSSVNKRDALPEGGVTMVEAAIVVSLGILVIFGGLEFVKYSMAKSRLKTAAIRSADRAHLFPGFFENATSDTPTQEDKDYVLDAAVDYIAQNRSALSLSDSSSWIDGIQLDAEIINANRWTGRVTLSGTFNPTFPVLPSFSVEESIMFFGEQPRDASQPQMTDCFGNDIGDFTLAEMIDNSQNFSCPCVADPDPKKMVDPSGNCICRTPFIDSSGDCACPLIGQVEFTEEGPGGYPIPNCICPECPPLSEVSDTPTACQCSCVPYAVSDPQTGACNCDSGYQTNPGGDGCECVPDPPCVAGDIAADKVETSGCACVCDNRGGQDQFVYDETNGCECSLEDVDCAQIGDRLTYNPGQRKCRCDWCRIDGTQLSDWEWENGTGIANVDATKGSSCTCNGVQQDVWADGRPGVVPNGSDWRGCRFRSCYENDYSGEHTSGDSCECSDLAGLEAHCLAQGRPVQVNANGCRCGSPCTPPQVPLPPEYTSCGCDNPPSCTAPWVFDEDVCDCACPQSEADFCTDTSGWQGTTFEAATCTCLCADGSPPRQVPFTGGGGSALTCPPPQCQVSGCIFIPPGVWQLQEG